jgi:hypothetical protein
MDPVSISLDDERAEKLARLADRLHLQPSTIARSLLSTAIDDADPDALNIVELLDGIPGAYERARLGLGTQRRARPSSSKSCSPPWLVSIRAGDCR